VIIGNVFIHPTATVDPTAEVRDTFSILNHGSWYYLNKGRPGLAHLLVSRFSKDIGLFELLFAAT